MEAEDPLSDLADIHLPGAVSFWPPAPGWWVIAALVLAAIAYGCFVLFRRWQMQRRQQVAAAEIQRAYQQWQQSKVTEAAQAGLLLLQTCNSVLKRVALVHYPEQEVAALNGQRWIEFLDRSGGTTEFTTGPARILADQAYRRSYVADANTAATLVKTAEQWITRQYSSKQGSGKQAIPEVHA